MSLIGGEALHDFARAFVLWRRVRAKVYNVLVAHENQYDKEGNLIVAAGGIVTCDTRLYDCADRTPLAEFRRHIQMLQHALWDEFLDPLKNRIEPAKTDLRTLAPRLAAWGIHEFVRFRLEQAHALTPA